ncbi:MarR family transcriptional regulator [Leucobacter zeae]|nr:MarR family transcriptional regulator [Leucobacter zeae]
MDQRTSPDASAASAEAREALILSALRGVRGFGDAHDRMAGSFKHGMRMNPSDIAALRLLIIREEQGRPVSPHEIAGHLRISTASTTKLLDRLSESGHVRREPHPSDRRARVVTLTDASRVEFFRLYGPRLAAIRQALAPFADAEIDAAVRVMAAVADALDPALDASARSDPDPGAEA